MTRWILLLLAREASAFCFLELEIAAPAGITEMDITFSQSYDVTQWLDHEDMDLYYTPRDLPGHARGGATRTRPMYMHMHGGAWKHTGQGNADRNGDMVPWLVAKTAQYGMVTSNIEYRLWHGVTENKSDPHYAHLQNPHGFIIEVGVEDSRAAIRYCTQRADLGIAMDMLIVSGDSAGGINALMLGYDDESQFEGQSGMRNADCNQVGMRGGCSPINTLAPPTGPGHSLPPNTNIATIVAISSTIGYWGFTAKDVRQAGKNDADWTASSLVQVVGDEDIIWNMAKTDRVNNNVARNPEAYYVGQTVIEDGNHIPIHPWVYDAYRRTSMSHEDWQTTVDNGQNPPWSVYKATCWWCFDNSGDLVDGMSQTRQFDGAGLVYMVDFMEHVACSFHKAPAGCVSHHEAFDCAPGTYTVRMRSISLGRNAVSCDCHGKGYGADGNQAHHGTQFGYGGADNGAVHYHDGEDAGHRDGNFADDDSR